MSFRNVDGSTEMSESESARLYSRILVVNDHQRQCALKWRSRLVSGGANPKTGAASEGQAKVMSALILFLTVVIIMALGIAASYAVVLGILQIFASQSRQQEAPAVLIPSQTHAHGD